MLVAKLQMFVKTQCNFCLTSLFMQIQDDCTALIKENAALSAQVVELQKQIDMVSQLPAYNVILGAFLWDDLDQDQRCRIAWIVVHQRN